MNWRVQSTLAGILGGLGLWVLFNPVTVVTAAASVIPWLLLAAGAVQFVSILFRQRRLIRLIIIPAVTGALFIYAGLSMKFGDPTTVGPVSLIFVLALVLFGSGAAKLFNGFTARRSKYFNFIIGSGALSVALGLFVLFSWQTVSAGYIGVILGLEIIADALVMAVLALRDRDGEAAMESLGLDPVAEAAKAEALREAAVARAAAEAAEIRAATEAAERKAAAAYAAATPPPPPRPAAAPPVTVPPVTVPPIEPPSAAALPPVAAPPPVTEPPAPKLRKPPAPRVPKPAARTPLLDMAGEAPAPRPAPKRKPKPPADPQV